MQKLSKKRTESWKTGKEIIMKGPKLVIIHNNILYNKKIKRG